MTKRMNWLPSERVDVPDMEAGTTGVAVGTMQQIMDDLVIAKFPRIASGFRVEIANQVSSPGEVTVWNGLAIDRDGQLVENDDEENTQRSITFGADGTYYLEVEFTTAASDSDARAFWDPTFDNGTDPSGDPRYPGRELFQTVSTRLSPDWEIVSPVSTTGFTVTTTPSTARIPVAIITIAAGVVSGATTFPARSCLSQTAAIGATRLYVLDSRVMPDAFSATVDAEVIAVSANDRANGILTLSGPLAAEHLSGARVVRTGAGLNQFLQYRADPALPTAGSEDARPGLFQGDEDRGYALAQNPEASSGRSDAQLQALKDQVDFLAAQLREVRFGAERGSDLGTLAPPAVFSSPRYYDRSGGLQGARYATVSIGDGTTSWGDFNVAQLGSADAALTAAVAALPAAGGIIFVKGSTAAYDFTTGVAISGRNVTLVGERGATTLRATAAAAVLQLTNCTLGLRDIAISRQAAATAVSAITTTTGGAMTTFAAYNSTIDGISGTAYLKGFFENCTIQEVAGGSSNGYAVSSRIVDCTFVNCTFTSATNAAGTRCMFVQGLGSKNIAMFACRFVAAGASQLALITLEGSNDGGGLIMENCIFTGAATVTVQDALVVGTALSFPLISIKNCKASGLGTGGLLNCTSTSFVKVENCYIPVGASGYGMNFATGCDTVRVIDCTFVHEAGGATTTYGALINGTCANFIFDRCRFTSCAYAIDFDVMTNIQIRNCFVNAAAGCGRAFVWVITSIEDMIVDNCVVDGLTDATSGLIAGVRTTAAATNVKVRGCTFRDFGGGAVAADVYGVYMANSVGTGTEYVISDCQFKNIDAGPANTGAGIYLDSLAAYYAKVTISGNSFITIGTSANMGRAIAGGSLQDTTISGNNIDGVGLSASALGGIGIGFLNLVNSTISGNNIANCADGVSFGGGIVVLVAANQLTITGNNIRPGECICAIGIGNTVTGAVGNLTITGNTCGSGLNGLQPFNGILVVVRNNATPSGFGNITITSNVVLGFEGYGIFVDQDDSIDVLQNVSVAHNTLHTSEDTGPSGIRVLYGRTVSVCGNTVNLANTDLDAKYAILTTGCQSIGISSNVITAGASSAVGMIRSTENGRGVICGNHMHVETVDAAFVGIQVDEAGGANMWVTSNQVYVGSGSAGLGASYGGNFRQTALTASQPNADPSAYVDPTALGDISTNWWGT